MTHNLNTWAKALISGGCVISKEINFDYRTFFLNNGILSQIRPPMKFKNIRGSFNKKFRT